MIDKKDKARIEAAIRFLDKRHKEARASGAYRAAWHARLMGSTMDKFADLLRWVLGQEQETWKPEDFGLNKETPNQKGG